jgi:hypothetical protein
MSMARTTPSAPAPSMPPTTASPGHWISAKAPSSDDGTTGPRQGGVQKDFVYIPPPLWILYPDYPSSATAGVSPAGTAAALSVAGAMAMMLL